jgi:hypothetical protein
MFTSPENAAVFGIVNEVPDAADSALTGPPPSTFCRVTERHGICSEPHAHQSMHYMHKSQRSSLTVMFSGHSFGIKSCEAQQTRTSSLQTLETIAKDG